MELLVVEVFLLLVWILISGVVLITENRDFSTMFNLVILGLLVAGLVWAIADRIRQKKQEDFEDRDN